MLLAFLWLASTLTAAVSFEPGEFLISQEKDENREIFITANRLHSELNLASDWPIPIAFTYKANVNPFRSKWAGTQML